MGGWNDSGCSDGYGDEEETQEAARDTALEAEYEKTYARVHPQIEECCKMAALAYKDAIRLAEAHGIPFSTSVIGRQHTYIPQVPAEKRAVVNATAGTWIDSDSATGWTNSSSNC